VVPGSNAQHVETKAREAEGLGWFRFRLRFRHKPSTRDTGWAGSRWSWLLCELVPGWDGGLGVGNSCSAM
jgi:hypothetical protein